MAAAASPAAAAGYTATTISNNSTIVLICIVNAPSLKNYEDDTATITTAHLTHITLSKICKDNGRHAAVYSITMTPD